MRADPEVEPPNRPGEPGKVPQSIESGSPDRPRPPGPLFVAVQPDQNRRQSPWPLLAVRVDEFRELMNADFADLQGLDLRKALESAFSLDSIR